MITQNDSIDTATATKSIRVELRKEDFAEMRMTLIALRDEIRWPLQRSEVKERLVERANSVLGKTDWHAVNFIF
jgi:hypothetical protein